MAGTSIHRTTPTLRDVADRYTTLCNKSLKFFLSDCLTSCLLVQEWTRPDVDVVRLTPNRNGWYEQTNPVNLCDSAIFCLTVCIPPRGDGVIHPPSAVRRQSSTQQQHRTFHQYRSISTVRYEAIVITIDKNRQSIAS